MSRLVVYRVRVRRVLTQEATLFIEAANPTNAGLSAVHNTHMHLPDWRMVVESEIELLGEPERVPPYPTSTT